MLKQGPLRWLLSFPGGWPWDKIAVATRWFHKLKSDFSCMGADWCLFAQISFTAYTHWHTQRLHCSYFYKVCSDPRPRCEISMWPVATLLLTGWPRALWNATDSVCLKRILFPGVHSLPMKKHHSRPVSRVPKWLRRTYSLLLKKVPVQPSAVYQQGRNAWTFSEAWAWKSGS